MYLLDCDSSPIQSPLHPSSIAYFLLRSLVEHSCINPKSLTFGYLDEKPIGTGLMKFLGLYPSALSWYLEFASAFSLGGTQPPYTDDQGFHLMQDSMRTHGRPAAVLPSSLTPCKMRSPHHNEEPIERHNLTLAYTRVHVFDLCPRKALCFRSIFPSSTLIPLMRLGHFTKFHPSCSTSRFALN
ncbi:hypothetical protein BHM03_00014898 [Ensete ventricosum]|nr:hypothetical protein BHM03_00014898 [Ensete ventricosum]